MNDLPAQLDDPDKKRELNRCLFNQIAGKYDLAAILLSFNQDQKWKSQLISAIPDYASGSILDLATGTGDLVAMLNERFADTAITGFDLSEAMLTIARQRFSEDENIAFEQGDIGAMPFEDESFGIVTGGYALRNVPQLEGALSEIHRVLQSNGTAYFLDFVQPDSRVKRAWNHGLLHFWGGLIGLLLHGQPWIYRYIPFSLSRFPTNKVLEKLAGEYGFDCAFYYHFGGLLQRIELNKRPG